MSALLIAAVALAQMDPMRLPIGAKGEITVSPGTLARTKDGKAVGVDEVAKAADKVSFVFLGENHATTAHQQMEADVIQALVKRGRNVVVGLEMYTRPKQEFLDQWSAGTVSEADFLTQSDWKGQWGYDFAFYRPVFNIVRENKLPLIALNVPRDWVRAVGKSGFAGLTDEQKAQLPPDLDLANKDHKSVFTALMGGHPMTGPQGDNIYAAQVLWDEGMADTALKYFAKNPPDKKTVFVVIAGAGHSMYRQGINYRVQKRSGRKGVTLVMGQSAEAAPVSKGVGDFVYITLPEEKKG